MYFTKIGKLAAIMHCVVLDVRQIVDSYLSMGY